MKKIGLLSIVLISLLIVGCGSEEGHEKGQWMGFYYPDRYNIGDSSLWVIEGGFDSLEECRNRARSRGRNSNDDYDYECGYKCKPSGGFYICEKTLD